MRATLAASLVEILDGLVPPDPSVRLTGLFLDLPLEVALAWDHAAPVLLAGPPRWRWTTEFDERPGRLALRLGEGIES
jgi:hypothetical protein